VRAEVLEPVAVDAFWKQSAVIFGIGQYILDTIRPTRFHDTIQ
jgi:hypothetical protein